MGCGFAVYAGVAPEVIRASARGAEAAGYTSFWVNYPGSVDGLAALALAAAETTRIALGVGVIPLHTHGPDRIIADVRANALPLDRLLLGVGARTPGRSRASGRGSPRCGRRSRAGSTSRRSDRACATSPARWPTACSSTG